MTGRRRSTIVSTLVAVLLGNGGSTCAAVDLPEGIALVGKTAHEPISEMSGIARSQRFPGAYWVHNDSGDDARLFAVDASGAVFIPDYLRARFHGADAEQGKEPWPGLSVSSGTTPTWWFARACGRLSAGGT